jgi:hypothetical protein
MPAAGWMFRNLPSSGTSENVSSPAHRTRSLPILLAVAFVPAVVAGIAGATAVGGSRAVVFGIVFGAILGGLAVLFALLLGRWTHRTRR